MVILVGYMSNAPIQLTNSLFTFLSQKVPLCLLLVMDKNKGWITFYHPVKGYCFAKLSKLISDFIDFKM